MREYKIIQILPAIPNMKSKYKDNDEFFTCPIVCIALVEYEDGEREILSMDITTGDGVIGAVNIYDKDFIEIITE